MHNKRTLIVSIVAILVVILGLAAFLGYTRTAGSPQTIPVTGRSNSAGQQNQAANSSVNNKFESAEQIQAQQGLDQQIQSAKGGVNSQWIPGQEYFQGQRNQSANSSASNNFESAEQIQAQQGLAQQNRYISPQEYEQRQFSK